MADKKPVSPEPATSTASAAPRPSGGKGLWIALAVVLLLVGGAGGWAFGIYLPQERAFEEMRERIAALPIAAESRAVEELDETVQAFVDAAPDRHVEPIEGAWAMRRDEIEMRREAFASLREEIGSLPPDASMAELEALDDVVDAYLRQAPEAHRDRIASEWAQQRTAIESYWENARGGLILDTEPSGAEVRIGGLSLEESPVRLSDLRLGVYEIEIVHPGYERWSGVVNIEDGRFTDLGAIELQRSVGQLEIGVTMDSIAWSLEKADEEIEPQQGEGPATIGLPTGTYTLNAQREGWGGQMHEVKIEREEISEIFLDFPYGSLRLESQPAGAEVWVGDNLIGETPYQIGQLPPGELRELEFRKEGFVTQSRGGRIEAGEALVLSVELVEGPVVGQNAAVELPGGVEFEMVWIEPGEFVMGSPNNEIGRIEDREGPQTRVRLNRGYWLGKTPVTQVQWQALMGNNPSYFWEGGLNAPVERVSWTEAMEFCRKLTERERAAGRLPEGYEYNLPSEAQWEYAARATSANPGQSGTTTRWSFGDNEASLGNYAWYKENSDSRTHPVASKRANPWGLYDVHGNVWEWTRSWFDDYPGGSVVDYEGPNSGSRRVARGGSWGDTAAGARSAYRVRLTPGYRNNFLGFRLALAPSP